MTDGDAAFLRVNNRLPAHALAPGEVAAAVNCRFEQGQPRPRFGVAVDEWGIINIVPKTPAIIEHGDTDLTKYSARLEVTGFIVGRQYNWQQVQATSLSTGIVVDPGGYGYAATGTIITSSGIFTAEATTYYLLRLNDGELTDLMFADRIFVAANTCAYKRFSDPVSGHDMGILVTDDWRDGAGEDGGGVGADRHEASLPQRQQPRRGRHIEAEGEDHVDPEEDHDRFRVLVQQHRGQPSTW